MTSHLTHVSAPEGLAPSPQYSHVVWGTGRFVAISGQVALDASGAVVGVADPAAQARQVFANLERCLAAAGAGFGDVVKLTYFLTDVAHLPAVRDARDAAFAGLPLPASSALQVEALVRPELLMEIEAFALVPERRPEEGPGEERPEEGRAELRLIR
ncbi:RidA family protein [Streptomyces hydrogenans]|uniref:RidA family protein n=1 Tax=Streptomyces hydrogenans TaxID=1873719 RepID=UPI003829D791